MIAPKKKSARNRKAPSKKAAPRKSSPHKKAASRKSSKKSPTPKCVRQFLAKYTGRPSPPFPANECSGMKMMGNDGQMYVSKPNKAGVSTWKKV